MKKFVIYNSSAGTGKTYTLVKEYLKIALATKRSNQYKTILAVTFTNKAAAEMKQRVIDALKQLSFDGETDDKTKALQLDLSKPESEGGLGINAKEIKLRSQLVLKSILHNYSDFGISTIDKFTHKIIKAFAHDLQMPLNFDIELNEGEALGTAIDLLIEKVGKHEQITKLLMEYTTKKATDEKSWHIEDELRNFSQNLLKEDGELYLKKIRQLSLDDFDAIKKQLYAQVNTFETTVKQFGIDGLAFIEAKGIEKNSFSSSFLPDYWKSLMDLKRDTEAGGLKNPTATTLKIIEGEKNWYAAKAKVPVPTHQKQLIDTFKTQFEDQFKASRTYIEEHESAYIVNNLIANNLYNLAVLSEIEKTLLTFKKETGTYGFIDFNKRIAAIVANEPIPFIYERLGERYHHYLIDEFQDTSTIQWHNLIPLVDSSLSTGKFNMVVGDAKQAIYRFRGGEVEQIISLPKLFQHNNNPILLEREAALLRNHHFECLDTNYRSCAEIVQFNNSFFQSVAQNLSEKYQPIYEKLNQKNLSDKEGGGIDIRFFDSAKKEESEELTLTQISNIIDAIIADGFQWKDIVVLTKRNAEVATVASYLLKKGIAVVSKEGLLLNNSEEVVFLLQVLNFIAEPKMQGPQVKVLSYLTQKIYNDDLVKVFETHPTNTVNAYLKSKEIEIDYAKINNYSLYELAEYLVVTFNFHHEVDVYIQFFLDKIQEYVVNNDNSILNFLEWWDKKSHQFSIVVPEGIDAINVMTIHKSKGLEFPIVIYPFATTVIRTSEKYFWTSNTNIPALKVALLPIQKEILKTNYAATYEAEINKSKLDLVNSLYVALTRPKYRLYIISENTKNPSSDGSIKEYLINYCNTHKNNSVGTNHYRFGTFAKAAAFKKQGEPPSPTQENVVFKSIAYNNWREKMRISYEAPLVWETENPEAIGAYGTVIHHILSHIKTLTDVDDAITNATQKGLITEVEAPKIKADIENLFKIAAVKELFVDVDNLKNERSILLPNGATYQPDRVVVKQDKTYLVDYKTGQQKTAHQKQIKHYKSLLAQMGYKNIIAYLLYLENGELLEC